MTIWSLWCQGGYRLVFLRLEVMALPCAMTTSLVGMALTVYALGLIEKVILMDRMSLAVTYVLRGCREEKRWDVAMKDKKRRANGVSALRRKIKSVLSFCFVEKRMGRRTFGESVRGTAKTIKVLLVSIKKLVGYAYRVPEKNI